MTATVLAKRMGLTAISTTRNPASIDRLIELGADQVLIDDGPLAAATYELLPRISKALRQELPDVMLDLHGELLTPAQVSGLLSGELDVGLLRPPVGDAALAVRSLRHEPLVAVLPEAHPLSGTEQVSVSDLRDEHFVGYPSHHRSVVHHTVQEACRGAGFSPRTTEVAETSTLVSFVAAGLGVALVPRSVQPSWAQCAE